MFLCPHSESSEAQISAQTLPEPDYKLLKGRDSFANGRPRRRLDGRWKEMQE